MTNEKAQELASEFLKLKEMCGWDFETAEECLTGRRYQFMLAAFTWVSLNQGKVVDVVEQHRTARGHFDPQEVARALMDLYNQENPEE